MARLKADNVASLHHVELVNIGKRINHFARRHGTVNDIASDDALQGSGFNIRKARLARQRADQQIKRRAAKPTVQPMAHFPVCSVAPKVNARGKFREWPRIVRIDIKPRRIDHCISVNA